MIKIILSGANGKMGKVIAELAHESGKYEICAGVDINTTPAENFSVYDNPYDFEGEADCIIDFSNPEALYTILDYALEKNLPIVVATTGLSEEQKKRLFDAAERIPVFFSANMSVGINLLSELAKKAARMLEEKFDIEIVEAHHRRKLDAPSGTALMLADAINEAVTENKDYIYDRHSKRAQRGKNEIGMHAIRGGTIVGEHSVIFAGEDEVIELKHSAQSRNVFAHGALSAAAFIKGKTPGLYNMTALVNEE